MKYINVKIINIDLLNYGFLNINWSYTVHDIVETFTSTFLFFKYFKFKIQLSRASKNNPFLKHKSTPRITTDT